MKGSIKTLPADAFHRFASPASHSRLRFLPALAGVVSQSNNWTGNGAVTIDLGTGGAFRNMLFNSSGTFTSGSGAIRLVTSTTATPPREGVCN